jgi:hypothetical protein
MSGSFLNAIGPQHLLMQALALQNGLAMKWHAKCMMPLPAVRQATQLGTDGSPVMQRTLEVNAMSMPTVCIYVNEPAACSTR